MPFKENEMQIFILTNGSPSLAQIISLNIAVYECNWFSLNGRLSFVQVTFVWRWPQFNIIVSCGNKILSIKVSSTCSLQCHKFYIYYISIFWQNMRIQIWHICSDIQITRRHANPIYLKCTKTAFTNILLLGISSIENHHLHIG